MKLSRPNVPYVQIANEILYRSDLSLKAKGLYAYLFSKPADWDFAAERIATECTEERKTILGVLKELERSGLLKRHRMSSGRVEYQLGYGEEKDRMTGDLFITTHQSPSTKLSRRRNATVAKAHGGVFVPVSNTYSESKKEVESKKEIQPAEGGGQLAEMIFLFKGINPTIGVLYGRPPQREAADRLLKLHPLSWWEQFMAGYAMRLESDKYCPRATTPVQMEAKLGAIMVYGRQLKSGSKVFTLA